MRFILYVLFFTLNACKTQPGQKGFSNFDRCMANKDYLWKEGQCIPRNALIAEETRCLTHQSGSRWVDGECIQDPSLNQGEQACLNRNDGSVWKNGECIASSMKFPKTEKTQEEISCKDEGFRFIQGICMGPNQKSCVDRGYQRRWAPKKDTTDDGQCVRRSFMEMCSDLTAPNEVKESLDVIKKAVGKISCQDAFEQLSEITSLSIENLNQGFSTLIPLAEFLNIKSLSLKNNHLQDIRMIQDMPWIIYLDLSRNEIASLSGLENLVDLETLILSDNLFYQLTPLQNLPNLKHLHMARVPQLMTLDSLLPIKNLNKLEDINLDDNCNLKNIDALKRLPALNYLGLNTTGVPTDALKDWGRLPSQYEHTLCP